MVITAPEKPFDAAEAEAIHDFVTEKEARSLSLLIPLMLKELHRNLGLLFRCTGC